MNLFSADDFFLVTGASSGIGQAIAVALVEHGASVIANGRDCGKLAETRAISSMPSNIYIETRDLTDNMDELPIWLKNLAIKYVPLRGLVCSAGVTINAPLSYYNIPAAQKVFNICCHSPLKLGGAFCNPRVHAGPQSSIVFIAAAAAIDPNPGQGIYAAAKGGLVAGAKCLAKEAAKKQIRINCISPGLVTGPMMNETIAQLGEAFLERERPLYPFGFGEPENVADLAVFLLSRKAGWLTGQNILLSGGR